jgi:glycosyltransferase involved in cell wall biosynthesis
MHDVLKIAIALGPFQPMPPEGIGAVEKVWHDLAQGFAKAGHDVMLIGKSGGSPSPIRPIGVRVTRMRGFEASASLYRNLAKDLLYSIEVGWRIEAADVIVTNSIWMPFVLTLPGKRRGKDIAHVARFPKGQMFLYRRADVLQAISSPVAAEIIRQSPSVRKKVRTLPYPVDLETYRPPEVPRARDGALTILYVGRVHPEKGLETLIQAFRVVVSKVPQSRLKIVGPVSRAQGGGGEAWLETLKTLARGMPVEFAKPIFDVPNLVLELQQAHCFCYPSIAEHGEAFGLSVLEAMATGLPVAVSALACVRDFLEAGREGLIFDHRAARPEEGLAESLIRLLTDHGYAKGLGDNAASKAKEFGLEKITKRYLSLFEDVADD